MLEALSTPRNLIRSVIMLAICGGFAVSAGLVGISDNPPGLLLAFLSTTAFVLSFVHPWRTSKRFGYLAAASALSFVVFVVLHSVFDVIASKLGDSGLVYELLNGGAIGFFLIATFVCPPGLLVGIIGLAIISRRERRSKQGSSTT